MGRVAGFKYRQIIKKLKKPGFEFDRQAAESHEIWFNPSTNKYTLKWTPLTTGVGRACCLCPTSFPKTILRADICHCTPIHWVNIPVNKRVKAAIWPVHYSIYVTVLYRIVVDVVAMPIEILVSSDLVFPESALPDRLLPFVPHGFRWRKLLHNRASAREV